MAAFTLTRNLKLRVDSNLTANAKYNLAKIDDLAGTFAPDNTDSRSIRARTDINILPEDASTGGSGLGGTVNIGTPSQLADVVNIYSENTLLGKAASFLDSATGGTKRLSFKYNSTLNGVVESVADRILSFDVEGGDRSLVLAQNLSLLGSFSTILRTTAATDVTLPSSGILATRAGIETFTNKFISASTNTLTNISNASISNTAAIAYSKLSLSNSIVNADVATAAAIAYSKLNLAGSIRETDLSNSIVIPYSALHLTNSIIDADISSSAGINYAKLALTGQIVNNDISAAAAIAGSKIVPNFGTQDIICGRLVLRGPSYRTYLQAAPSGSTNDSNYSLPSSSTTVGVLSNDGSGVLTWATIAGSGTVTSVALSLPSIFTVSGSPVTGSGTLTGSLATQSANTVFAGPTTGSAAAPTFRSIVVADLPTSIPATNIGSGSVDDTELGYLNGVTSSIQTQLGNLQPLDSDLTALAALSTTGLISRTGSGTVATRSIAAAQPYITVADGDGVSGNPTLDLAIDAATSTTPATDDELLIWDTSASATRKVQVSDILGLSGASFAADWTSSTTTTVTHNLGSRDVLVELYDNTTFETILIDSIVRTTTNTVDLTASQAPSGAGWRVLIKKI